MVAVSCFYNIYDKSCVKYIFIKYENYFKVIINSKSIILSNKSVVNNKQLFQIYILSLLCTNDTSTVDIMTIKNKSTELYIPSTICKNIYGIFAEKYLGYNYFTNYSSFVELDENIYRNPLLSIEPKRESGNKKIRKFEKLFYKSLTTNDTPIDLIIEYYNVKTSVEYTIIDKYKYYNKKIMLLMCVNRRLGNDIYKYLKETCEYP
jgi:hypothetical protein